MRAAGLLIVAASCSLSGWGSGTPLMPRNVAWRISVRSTKPLIRRTVLAAEFPTDIQARHVLGGRSGVGDHTNKAISTRAGLQVRQLHWHGRYTCCERPSRSWRPTCRVSTRPAREPRYRVADPYSSPCWSSRSPTPRTSCTSTSRWWLISRQPHHRAPAGTRTGRWSLTALRPMRSATVEES
jgi:hypothetical protein